MGINKFIKQARAILGLQDKEKEDKKKYLKKVLKKLNNRKRDIKSLLDDNIDKKELQEELEIISLQIKKGKKILYTLYNNE